MLQRFPSVAVLDGIVVLDSERVRIRDAYSAAMSRFAERVDGIKRLHEHRLREVTDRRQRARQQAADSKQRTHIHIFFVSG